MGERTALFGAIALALAGGLASAVSAGAAIAREVTNTDDSGEGSLRRVIEIANTDFGFDTGILFNIPGDGPHTIQPLSPLPAANRTVFIDATTQEGFAGTPVIEIDGSMAGADATGLELRGEGSVVRGIAVNNFDGSGIHIAGANGARVQGCFIGTDLTGMTAKPNGGQAIKGFAGVEVDDAADVLIGGPASGEGNLISGNSARGISIQGDVGDTCTVQGNLIGTDITGLAPLPNQIENVLLATLGEQSLVGGANPGEGNVIAGCSGFGLRINGGREQRVWGNLIGVGVDGVTAVPNGAGVGIQSADLNEIGAPGAGNVISGNSNVGIAFLGFNPDGNRIRANRIGTDSTGTVAVPNGTDGVNILTGVGNVIGGRASGEGNLISGNGETGIRIAGATAQGNVIEGNLIGTDVTGMAALGNGQFGVMITDSPGNHVGNPLPGGGNVISGNGLTANHGGVSIEGPGATGNTVQGNRVGTDITGTEAIPNFNGVRIRVDAEGCVIGGPATGEGNLISGNRIFGIFLGGTDDITVQGNLIGTDVTGHAPLGNELGIGLGMVSQSTIGGFAPADGNVISGNLDSGIRISGGLSTGNFIEANRIGVAADGVTPLGNGERGIEITGDARDSTIGLNGPGNIIAHNGGAGVAIMQGMGIRVRENVIHSNGGLGIDLGGDGVTMNDALDADDGPNGLTNFPTIVSAEIDDMLIHIEYEFNGEPDTIYIFETFISRAPDPSGFGEGSERVHARSETTSSAGLATWEVNVGSHPGAGRYVTATATAPDGSTSEFSPAFLASGRGPSVDEVVDHILGRIPDPGDLDVNEDSAVDAADVVDLINPQIGPAP